MDDGRGCYVDQSQSFNIHLDESNRQPPQRMQHLLLHVTKTHGIIHTVDLKGIYISCFPSHKWVTRNIH
ncbi:hypothetical protein YC2023_093953 [Brassica napus]